VRWAAPLIRREGVLKIADFGSGTLRNLSVQEKSFDEITLVETKRRCEALAQQVRGKNHLRLLSTHDFSLESELYDAVFFICVLHTIPDPSYRQRLVNMAVEKLKPGGFIVVDVPHSETYYNRRRRLLPRYKDGYLLRWGDHCTFYKRFYRSELDAMFEKIPKIQLFRKTWYCKHLIRIWRSS
jgi:SAM-dependent methyltransferase